MRPEEIQSEPKGKITMQKDPLFILKSWSPGTYFLSIEKT